MSMKMMFFADQIGQNVLQHVSLSKIFRKKHNLEYGISLSGPVLRGRGGPGHFHMSMHKINTCNTRLLLHSIFGYYY